MGPRLARREVNAGPAAGGAAQYAQCAPDRHHLRGAPPPLSPRPAPRAQARTADVHMRGCWASFAGSRSDLSVTPATAAS